MSLDDIKKALSQEPQCKLEDKIAADKKRIESIVAIILPLGLLLLTFSVFALVQGASMQNHQLSHLCIVLGGMGCVVTVIAFGGVIKYYSVIKQEHRTETQRVNELDLDQLAVERLIEMGSRSVARKSLALPQLDQDTIETYLRIVQGKIIALENSGSDSFIAPYRALMIDLLCVASIQKIEECFLRNWGCNGLNLSFMERVTIYEAKLTKEAMSEADVDCLVARIDADLTHGSLPGDAIDISKYTKIFLDYAERCSAKQFLDYYSKEKSKIAFNKRLDKERLLRILQEKRAALLELENPDLIKQLARFAAGYECKETLKATLNAVDPVFREEQLNNPDGVYLIIKDEDQKLNITTLYNELVGNQLTDEKKVELFSVATEERKKKLVKIFLTYIAAFVGLPEDLKKEIYKKMSPKEMFGLVGVLELEKEPHKKVMIGILDQFDKELGKKKKIIELLGQNRLDHHEGNQSVPLNEALATFVGMYVNRLILKEKKEILRIIIPYYEFMAPETSQKLFLQQIKKNSYVVQRLNKKMCNRRDMLVHHDHKVPDARIYFKQKIAELDSQH